jgi:hypothetical protein
VCASHCRCTDYRPRAAHACGQAMHALRDEHAVERRSAATAAAEQALELTQLRAQLERQGQTHASQLWRVRDAAAADAEHAVTECRAELQRAISVSNRLAPLN